MDKNQDFLKRQDCDPAESSVSAGARIYYVGFLPQTAAGTGDAAGDQ